MYKLLTKYNISNIHLFDLLAILSIIIWSKFNCYNNFTWILEALPVLITLPTLIMTYFRFRFTNLSYFLIVIHCTVLLIGAHYTYERVPLFHHIKDIFNFTRNHCDRLGHFFNLSKIMAFIKAMKYMPIVTN